MPERRTEPILVEPACEIACRTCLMVCAALPSRLAWWERKVEELCRERSLRPNCLETRRALDKALAGHADLKRQLAGSPRAGNQQELLGELGRPFALGRTH